MSNSSDSDQTVQAVRLQLIEEAKLKNSDYEMPPQFRDGASRGRVIQNCTASLEAEPIAWRYRYVKKGVMDSQGELWVGDWKYVPKKEDCNDRPNYEIQALFTAHQSRLHQKNWLKLCTFMNN
ncbi:bacteriophage protein [Shigella boydii]|uniref:Bacteriophage protein n=1 Tax=Shigella boydii TaxID=621 RepID=A0A2X2HUK3_SHIBO|nr:bacteriophage protein [Shigella boydii]